MPDKYYFLGRDNKRIIRLFSVEERECPNNKKFFDLELFFPGRGLFKISNKIEELIKDVIEDDYQKTSLDGGPHISVHYHPEQPSIFINKTTTEEQGCKILGIKDRGLFAPVILKIFGTTKTPVYNSKEKHLNRGVETNINFNSDTDTLVMFFLVSKTGVEFHKDVEYPANYFEKDFKNFRLTVIYRYFNMPPEKPTINMSLVTPPGDSFAVNGIEWWQTCNLLNDLEMSYVTEYFKKHPERNYPYLNR